MQPIQRMWFCLMMSYLFVFVTTASAQNISVIGDDVKDTWTVTKDLAAAIAQPSAQDWQAFAFGSAAVLTAALLDKPVRKGFQNNQSSAATKFFRIDDYYGSRRFMPAATLALYITGFLSGNRDLRLLGLKSMQAITYTGLLTVAVKEVVGRSRPYRDEGPFHFKPFGFRESSRSFFSGHTSITFAMSTVMAREVDNIFWQVFWYGAAGWVAGARMYNDKHWLSDVVAGALVGYAVGQFVSRRVDELDREHGQATLIPATSPYRGGYQFTISLPLR